MYRFRTKVKKGSIWMLFKIRGQFKFCLRSIQMLSLFKLRVYYSSYSILITVFCLFDQESFQQFLNWCIQQDTFFADSFLVKTIVRIEVNQPFLIQVTYIKSVWTYRKNNHIPSFSIKLCHIMCTASFQGIDLQFLEVEQVVIEMSDQNQ